MGNEENREAAMAAFSRASGYIRTAIGQRIRMRHVPEITFVLDRSIEHGDRIARLLKEVVPEGEAGKPHE